MDVKKYCAMYTDLAVLQLSLLYSIMTEIKDERGRYCTDTLATIILQCAL